MASDLHDGEDLAIMGTDVFDFGLDHNEPAPAVKRKHAYEDIMGIGEGEGGNRALSTRLVAFREWLDHEADVTIHPNLCVVNGEATDGTKNAPMLSYGPPPGVNTGNMNPAEGRIGAIDGEADQALYDRSMGCQVRATKEIKKDDVLLTVPRSAMVTPDLVASSDAGRALLACIEPGRDGDPDTYWDAFENTATLESTLQEKINLSNGTQLLVKILQERKKAETAEVKCLQAFDDAVNKAGGLLGTGRDKVQLSYTLAHWGKISTRAPILAFLIHQRFSDCLRPEVVGNDVEIAAEMEDCRSVLSTAKRIQLPTDSPTTFAPYARILPSAVPLPLCWKRNELALFSQCVPGVVPLQEVAGMTLLLASEFIALVDAGILHRFPSVFPRGLITWERWVWAASVYTSRALPSSTYLDDKDNTITDEPSDPLLFQSDPAVWTELGVMIPFLDMLNHEAESSQVVWVSPPASNGKNHASCLPRAVSHRRVKKGSELYCNYGPNMSNQHLILQYGFGLINNPSDVVRLGWSLADSVGNVKAPVDYSLPFKDEAPDDKLSVTNESSGGDNTTPETPKLCESDLVFDSTEPSDINDWWTEERLSFLSRQALLGENIITSLTSGKKMLTAAFNDGSYHPHLLAASVVATMNDVRVMALDSLRNVDSEEKSSSVAITKTHQNVLRAYLAFHFESKLEKLLQNLNSGLKGHFEDVNIWTKLSNGGLAYSNPEDKTEGWNKFFEAKAYFTSAAVEKHFYPVSPESCVLAFYDGQVRALQASLDGLGTMEKFRSGVLRQLEDLGFEILSNDDLPAEEVAAMTAAAAAASKVEEDNDSVGKTEDGPNGAGKEKNKSKSRRRNRKQRTNGGESKGGPPECSYGRPAIKLHIGNLAYCTLASDLFDYFASRYGRESVLECHIPTERESGRSRGFGFVTMPEASSLQALRPGIKHEVHGRILKIAESSSSGSANRNRGPSINTIVVTDRCARCGYRPRYCVCPVPDIPAFNGAASRLPYQDNMRGPDLDHRGRGDPIFDNYGGNYRRERERGRDSYSPSPGRHHSGGRGGREWDNDWHGRAYDRSRRSHSPSYSRERDLDRDRSRRRSRERDHVRDRDGDRRERSRDRRRGLDDRRSSRHSRSRSRSPLADTSEVGRSSRRERDRDRDEERRTAGTKPIEHASSGNRDISDAESMSPPPLGGSSERKRSRESRRRSRSRSRDRGKSGKKRRSSKKDGKKRDRSPH